jgi:uncharacterized OB-fold protein
MAKKKARKAPTRTCESCGAAYHPRKSSCPKCGAANPTAGRRKAVKRAAARKKGARVATVDTLGAAVSFVSKVGGLKNAKAAIARIEEIKGL